MNELLTMKETAEQLQTNVNYIHNLRKAGLLPVLKLGNFKVRKQSLEDFLKKWEGWDLTDPYHPKELKDEKEAK